MKQVSRITGSVRHTLEESAARLQQLETAVHDERLRLERRLATAGAKLKGTRDLTMLAADSATEVRVEVALRGPDAPLTIIELANRLHEPADRVHRVMRRLRETPCPTAAADSGAQKVFNHGLDTDPTWSWVIGDAVDAQPLYRAIEVMLRRRPYTFRELQIATGARRGRISGATVEFARSDLPVYTVGGSDRRYAWFIGALSSLPSDLRRQARAVRLAPDKNKV
jgi:hypothetical protein